jgi:hypothetical protein
MYGRVFKDRGLGILPIPSRDSGIYLGLRRIEN